MGWASLMLESQAGGLGGGRRGRARAGGKEGAAFLGGGDQTPFIKQVLGTLLRAEC